MAVFAHKYAVSQFELQTHHETFFANVCILFKMYFHVLQVALVSFKNIYDDENDDD